MKFGDGDELVVVAVTRILQKCPQNEDDSRNKAGTEQSS